MPYRLRLRLTLLHCLMAVASGTLLLLVMYGLARQLPGHLGYATRPGPIGPFAPEPGAPVRVGPQTAGDRIDLALPTFALLIVGLASLALGWLVAGRTLRPVRTMTERLRRISDHNVHERLSLTGPQDELKNLADTVDGLLGRLEAALDAHKRFVANAAHELRTPLTVEHALLEEPLIDPDADAAAFRANFERLLAVNEQRTRLLESLLTLAGSAEVRAGDEPFDLASVAARTLEGRGREDVEIDAVLDPAPVAGDPALIDRLVANLCDNALHYNVPQGRVEISTGRSGDTSVLRITNTGPVVPPEKVDGLFEPFQRLHRTADDGHQGLGLSIVRAIATAHGATLTARARPHGGLTVQITFTTPQGE
ncbi:ATP-binding protein [Actinomadura sp. NPDC048394]|uniref:sensor histidine kinase n=1 Tax=Actinomadura sp. NPDC048394 TaxID=3158223 RepID=UPI0033E3314A